MNKNLELLKNDLLKVIETIPGVVDFASINAEDKNYILINENANKKIDINLSIIANQNVNSKTISKQIYESVQFELKQTKENWQLNKLNIYIRGAK